MAAKNGHPSFSAGGVTPGERVNRFQHAFRRSSRGSSSGGRPDRYQISPYPALVCSKSPIDVADMYRTSQFRHDAPQLGKRVMLQIDPPRIFRRKMRLDAQRRVDLPEGLFVGRGERVASAFRCVPTRGERTCRRRCRRPPARRCRRIRSARRAHRYAQPHPDRRQAEARQDQHQRDEHGIQPQQAVLEFRHHGGGRVPGGALPPAALDRRRRN